MYAIYSRSTIQLDNPSIGIPPQRSTTSNENPQPNNPINKNQSTPINASTLSFLPR
jgi:hypothetical protein